MFFNNAAGSEIQSPLNEQRSSVKAFDRMFEEEENRVSIQKCFSSLAIMENPEIPERRYLRNCRLRRHVFKNSATNMDTEDSSLTSAKNC